jgi:hypothetical protein
MTCRILDWRLFQSNIYFQEWAEGRIGSANAQHHRLVPQEHSKAIHSAEINTTIQVDPVHASET